MSNDQSALTKEFSLSAQELLDKAIENGEGIIASNGALSVETGERTGRSPNDRFIVKEPSTEDLIDWGEINKPFQAEDGIRDLVRSRGLGDVYKRQLFQL